MALFAHKLIPGALDDSSLEVYNEMGRIKDEGVTKDKLYQGADVLMISDANEADTHLPNLLIGLTENTKDMSAADSNQVVALGQVCVASGNAFEGVIADIASATNYRITAIVNRSGGTLLVSVADETNMKINGQGKRMSIADKGYAVLMEIANDNFAITIASGVSLVAYAT